MIFKKCFPEQKFLGSGFTVKKYNDKTFEVNWSNSERNFLSRYGSTRSFARGVLTSV